MIKRYLRVYHILRWVPQGSRFIVDRYRVSVGLELIEGAGPDVGFRPFDTPLVAPSSSMIRRSGSNED